MKRLQRKNKGRNEGIISDGPRKRTKNESSFGSTRRINGCANERTRSRLYQVALEVHLWSVPYGLVLVVVVAACPPFFPQREGQCRLVAASTLLRWGVENTREEGNRGHNAATVVWIVETTDASCFARINQGDETGIGMNECK